MRTTRRMALAITTSAALLAGSAAVAGAAVIRNAPEITPAVIVDASGAEAVEPEAIMLDPANTSDAVNFISWWVWNDVTAVGSGVQQLNLCEPTCAEGTVISRSVVVELGDAEERDGDAPAQFTSARITTADGTRAVNLGQIAVVPVD